VQDSGATVIVDPRKHRNVTCPVHSRLEILATDRAGPAVSSIK
jgi:hypothetical protein